MSSFKRMARRGKGNGNARSAGNAEIAMDLNRTIERTRGCWNCKHWNNGDLAKDYWLKCRQRDLATGLVKANHNPDGENHPEVVTLRRMVHTADKGVGLGVFGICLAGKSPGDFVHNAYLCDHWSGAEGHSVATSGTKLDLLPEELKERIDGDGK
jgi:hypothetical protein